MDYSYKNIREIQEQVLKLGMLSPPDDVIACWLVFKNLRPINSMLELGSYLGGGLAIFNQVLKETGHANVQFLGVDHLDFIGAAARNRPGAWYTDHFNKCLSQEERDSLYQLNDAQEAANWIAKRTLRLTGSSIMLDCVKTEQEIGDKKFNIIHHDYGDSVRENLETIRLCVPKLADDGIYIVDDWCTGAPFRTIATVIAQQEKLLYPVLWAKNKVFYAKSQEVSQQLVQSILKDPDNNPKLFKVMPGSEYFGTGYKSIRMHWQAIQWS